METDAIRILLVDDHKLVRAGIRSLIEKLPGMKVVGEANDGREALRLAAQCRPEVILMDIAMPGLNGLEATRRLKKRAPGAKVVILSIYTDEEHVWQALRSGADGYLVKGGFIEELDLAIKAVAHGETYLSPPVSKPVIAEYVKRTVTDVRSSESLTPRQAEILQLIAEGRTTKQIAYELNIGVKTVESHRVALMRRIGVSDIAGLVRFAIKIGLVNLN
jgi:DNA-binding NarL/FixJ family response regulator